jgi:hypothetical protein
MFWEDKENVYLFPYHAHYSPNNICIFEFPKYPIFIKIYETEENSFKKI